MTPAQLLAQLVRFETVNPPGGEAACIGFLRELLQSAGIESRVFALDPARPNLVARVEGRGEAPPLLLYGHVDVVPVAGQPWSAPPFAAEERDGFVWGRGTLDMKAGVAMFVSAFMRAAADPPPGDLLLCVLADEEAGGVYGARFMVEQHADLFAGVRHALGEFGGFTLQMARRRLYPVMVAEKQSCRVIASVSGPGGHAALPMRGGALGRLARVLDTLDRRRLPVHVTPPVRLMLEALAGALPGPRALLVRRLLQPALIDRVLDLMGAEGRALDALLHNTASATIVHAGEKLNVIPALAEVELDGRLVPGAQPGDLVRELGALLGPGVKLRIDQYDPGPAGIDMTGFETLAGVLRDADPGGRPIPFVLPAVTDARHLARLGIQTYGFTPMRLPPGFDFMSTIHGADERIPAGEVEWGAAAVWQAVSRWPAD